MPGHGVSLGVRIYVAAPISASISGRLARRLRRPALFVRAPERTTKRRRIASITRSAERTIFPAFFATSRRCIEAKLLSPLKPLHVFERNHHRRRLLFRFPLRNLLSASDTLSAVLRILLSSRSPEKVVAGKWTLARFDVRSRILRDVLSTSCATSRIHPVVFLLISNHIRVIRVCKRARDSANPRITD